MKTKRTFVAWSILFGSLLAAANLSAAATPSPALLIVEKQEHRLAIADPATNKVVATVPCGLDPHEVVVSDDGKTAYVSNFAPWVVEEKPGRTITVIDLVAQKQVRQIDLGPLSMPHGLFFSEGKLYFTAQGYRVVGRYDPAIDKVDWMFGTNQYGTHMVIQSLDKKALFAANSRSNSISIIEAAPGLPPWKETVIPVGEGPEAIDISPDGKEIWTGNGRSGSVSILDVAGLKLIETVDLKITRTNRLKFTTDGRRVLLSDMRGVTVFVVDAATRKVIKEVTVGKMPEGIQMSPDGKTAYVAVAGENNIAVLDLDKLVVTGRIATGTDPDGMAWRK